MLQANTIVMFPFITWATTGILITTPVVAAVKLLLTLSIFSTVKNLTGLTAATAFVITVQNQ